MTVLDTSALIALLFGERGAEKVEAVMRGAALSTVNYCETLAVMTRLGRDVGRLRQGLLISGLSIVPFEARHAEVMAELERQTRSRGLSLGDRACLALGILRNETVLTADRPWADLALGVRVELIR
jgi:ribonuclease VapC